MTSVEGRSILITGGGGGIGFGAARHFVERGARVTICGRREEKMAEAQDALGKACCAVPGDITNDGTETYPGRRGGARGRPGRADQQCGQYVSWRDLGTAGAGTG